MRRVRAIVEVDGKEVEMEFITNNSDWSPASVCDLNQSRWGIEVFFKQIKQNLKLCDFLGNSANAVRWQVWTALLSYVLLRYLAYLSERRAAQLQPVVHDGQRLAMEQAGAKGTARQLWDSRWQLPDACQA